MASESTIGPGTTIRGSIRGEGDLDIHGRIEGSVAVSGELLIAETALIRSDVSGRRVVVRGAILGNISADEAIVLEPGARVVGDLEAPKIGIRPGGLVRGNVSTEATSGAITVEPATVARARTSPKAASVIVAPIGKATPARQPAAAAPRQAPPVAPLPPVRPPPRPAAAAAPPARAGAALPSAARPPAPAPAPRPAEPASSPASTPSGATHSETVLSAHPAPPAKHEPEHEEEGTSLSEPDGAGGPPPPVVPALRKGAKASLRRKGAR